MSNLEDVQKKLNSFLDRPDEPEITIEEPETPGEKRQLQRQQFIQRQNENEASPTIESVEQLSIVEDYVSTMPKISEERLKQNAKAWEMPGDQHLGQFNPERFRNYIDNPNPNAAIANQELASMRQGFFDSAFKEFGYKLPVGALLMTGELSSHILDFNFWNSVGKGLMNTLAGEDLYQLERDAFSNAASTFFRETREGMNEGWAQTFRHDPEKVWDFDDPTWYLQNLSGLGQSLGAFLGIGSAASLAFRGGASLAIRGISSISRPGSWATSKAAQGLAQKIGNVNAALTLGYSEGRLNAEQVAREQYDVAREYLLEEGYNEQEAKERASQIAANAAGRTGAINTILVPATRVLTLAPLFRHQHKLKLNKSHPLAAKKGETFSQFKSRIQNVGVESVMPNNALRYSREAFMEGLEEYMGAQSQAEGERFVMERLEDKDAMSVGEGIIKNILNPETHLEIALGAIGGIGQYAGTYNLPFHKDSDGNRISGMRREMNAYSQQFREQKKELTKYVGDYNDARKQLESALREEDPVKVEAARGELFDIVSKQAITSGAAQQIKLLLEGEKERLQNIRGAEGTEGYTQQINQIEDQLSQIIDGFDPSSENKEKVITEFLKNQEVDDEQRAQVVELRDQLLSLEENITMKELDDSELGSMINEISELSADIDVRSKKAEDLISRYAYDETANLANVGTILFGLWDADRNLKRRAQKVEQAGTQEYNAALEEELADQPDEVREAVELLVEEESNQGYMGLHTALRKTISAIAEKNGIDTEGLSITDKLSALQEYVDFSELTIDDILDMRALEENNVELDDSTIIDIAMVENFLRMLLQRADSNVAGNLYGTPISKLISDLESRTETAKKRQKEISKRKKELGPTHNNNAKKALQNITEHTTKKVEGNIAAQFYSDQARFYKRRYDELINSESQEELTRNLDKVVEKNNARQDKRVLKRLHNIDDVESLLSLKADAVARNRPEVIESINRRIKVLQSDEYKQAISESLSQSDEQVQKKVEEKKAATQEQQDTTSKPKNTPPQDKEDTGNTDGNKDVDLSKLPKDMPKYIIDKIKSGAYSLKQAFDRYHRAKHEQQGDTGSGVTRTYDQLNDDIDSILKDIEAANEIESVYTEKKRKLVELEDLYNMADHNLDKAKVKAIFDNAHERLDSVVEEIKKGKETDESDPPTQQGEEIEGNIEQDNKIEEPSVSVGYRGRAYILHNGELIDAENAFLDVEGDPRVNLPSKANAGTALRFSIDGQYEGIASIKIEAYIDNEWSQIGYVRDYNKIYTTNTTLPRDKEDSHTPKQWVNVQRKRLKELRDNIEKKLEDNDYTYGEISGKSFGSPINKLAEDSNGNIIDNNGQRVFDDNGDRIEDRVPAYEQSKPVIDQVNRLEDIEFVYIKGNEFKDLNGKAANVDSELTASQSKNLQGATYILIQGANGERKAFPLDVPYLKDTSLSSVLKGLIDKVENNNSQDNKGELRTHLEMFTYTRTMMGIETFNDSNYSGPIVATKKKTNDVYIGNANSGIIYTTDKSRIARAPKVFKDLFENIDAVTEMIGNLRFHLNKESNKTRDDMLFGDDGKIQVYDRVENEAPVKATYSSYKEFVATIMKTDISFFEADGSPAYTVHPTISYNLVDGKPDLDSNDLGENNQQDETEDHSTESTSDLSQVLPSVGDMVLGVNADDAFLDSVVEYFKDIKNIPDQLILEAEKEAEQEEERLFQEAKDEFERKKEELENLEEQDTETSSVTFTPPDINVDVKYPEAQEVYKYIREQFIDGDLSPSEYVENNSVDNPVVQKLISEYYSKEDLIDLIDKGQWKKVRDSLEDFSKYWTEDKTTSEVNNLGSSERAVQDTKQEQVDLNDDEIDNILGELEGEDSPTNTSQNDARVKHLTEQGDINIRCQT